MNLIISNATSNREPAAPTLRDLGLGEEAIGYAHEIKTYALRKLGEMLRTGQESGQILKSSERRTYDAVPVGNNISKTSLSDLGIDRKVSMLAQRIADLPLEKVEQVARRVKTLNEVRKENSRAKEIEAPGTSRR